MNAPPCLDCGTTGGYLRHGIQVGRPERSRGLCGRCARRHRTHGTHINYHRATMPIDDLLDAWHNDDHRPGDSIKARTRALAPRLGMTPETIEKAIGRAKRKGLL